MTITTNKRIDSIDLLKGIVMVVMALDHVRDYFHSSAFLFDPTDPEHTNIATYFTRWITHYCAPTFSFLAGVSAYLVGRRKSKKELSAFLFKRGLWLALIEVTIVNFAWFFDVQFRMDGLFVIWALGISMIFLAMMVHLPKNIILIVSLVIIFGHNLLDNLHYEGSLLWAIIHDGGNFVYSPNFSLAVGYPLIPWIAVMSLGYYFGTFYENTVESGKRKKIFNRLGLISIVLFFVIRYINVYGDPFGWTSYDTPLKSMFSFMNPAKYPPSLLYLLMTLGPALIFLANSENLSGRVVNFFKTFGRVPFFYYILHLYLIHLTALVFAQLSGFGWRAMILPDWVSFVPALQGYGFSLLVVYLVWIGVIAFLYPLCRKFEKYKMANKTKGWLSYL